MQIWGLDKRTEGDLLLSAPKGMKILWYHQVVHYLKNILANKSWEICQKIRIFTQIGDYFFNSKIRTQKFIYLSSGSWKNLALRFIRWRKQEL